MDIQENVFITIKDRNGARAIVNDAAAAQRPMGEFVHINTWGRKYFVDSLMKFCGEATPLLTILKDLENWDIWFTQQQEGNPTALDSRKEFLGALLLRAVAQQEDLTPREGTEQLPQPESLQGD